LGEEDRREVKSNAQAVARGDEVTHLVIIPCGVKSHPGKRQFPAAAARVAVRGLVEMPQERNVRFSHKRQIAKGAPQRFYVIA